MTRFLSRLRKDVSGNILVLGAAAMPVFIGAAGLATDTILWALWKREIQRSADSAAMAGALTVQQAKYQAERAAIHDFKKSRAFKEMQARMKFENSPRTGPWSKDDNAVYVEVEMQRLLPFSNFFLGKAPTIAAGATATMTYGIENCLVALEKTDTGIKAWGSSSTKLDCGVMSNSVSANSIVGGGSASIIAPYISAVGSIPDQSHFTGDVREHQPPQIDPLQDLADPKPPMPSCKTAKMFNDKPADYTEIWSNGGTTCFSGMMISGNVKFNPGVYYIVDNNFDIGSGARVSGSGVTFILTSSTGGAGAKYPRVTMNGSPHLNLSAPTEGEFKDLLFYQDRKAPANSESYFTGDSSTKLQGNLYFPATSLKFSGNYGMDVGCFKMVARRFELTGNAHLKNLCPTPDNRFAGKRVRLVA